MNTSLYHRLLLHTVRLGVFLILFTGACQTARAAFLRPGDVVSDFTFIAREPFTRPDGSQVAAGDTVHITDFAGRIVFLEWFAVWCPYCVAAAPQVASGIAAYYETRGGNPFGVPVLHVGVNQERGQNYAAPTDAFVKQQRFSPVVNDYTPSSLNPVRKLFQASGQPVFVVINGVTNSPTHKPWEVLVNHLGYGSTQFSQQLATFRAIIDTVQPGAVQPQISSIMADGTGFGFNVQTQPGHSYRVEATSDFVEWSTLVTITGSATPSVFRDTNGVAGQRFYRLVTP